MLFSKAGSGWIWPIGCSWLTTGLYPEPVSLGDNTQIKVLVHSVTEWWTATEDNGWCSMVPSHDPHRRCNHVKLLFANIGKFTEFNLSATPICGWKSTSVYFKILYYFWFQIWMVSGSFCFSNTWHAPWGQKERSEHWRLLWTRTASLHEIEVVSSLDCERTEVQTHYETRTKSHTHQCTR